MTLVGDFATQSRRLKTVRGPRPDLRRAAGVRAHFSFLLVVAIFPAAVQSAGAQCPGDCDGDARVSVAELVKLVGCALADCDRAEVATCLGSVGSEGGPSISILVLAVRNMLDDCRTASISCSQPGRDCTLREVAAELGMWIGTAVEPGPLRDDAQYRLVVARDFNSLSPENAMKWPALHPRPDQFSFEVADDLVDFGERNGMRIDGVTLIWGEGNGMPTYLESLQSAEEARIAMSEHIATVVRHFAGRVTRWNVVNEPITDVGFNEHVFFRLLGPSYVAEALRAARAADPAAELYVNDYSVLLPGPKQDRFFDLVAGLVGQGEPLDGVGFQGHLGLGAIPSADVIERSLRRFSALGLNVEITEIDLPLGRLAGDLATQLARQAEIYGDVVRGCLRVPACRGITTWGVADHHSWYRTFFGQPEEGPLLFSDDYARKPAYFAVRDALLEGLDP